MSEKSWYVRMRGRVIGPLQLQQLKSLRDRGQFRSFHEVSDDKRAWRPASTLTDVFAVVSTEESQAAYVLAEPKAAAEKPDVHQPADLWFYVAKSGKQEGPVSRHQLLDMWARGDITAMTLVWKEGLSSWIAISGSELGSTPNAAAEISPVTVLHSGTRPDVSRALLTFLGDPVGGLAPLCEALGNGWSMALGLAFGALFDLCMALDVFLIHEQPARLPADVVAAIPFAGVAIPAAGSEKITLMFKLLICAVLPLISLAGAIGIIRMVTRGNGRIGYDFVIAGATLLPIGLCCPIAVLLGNSNIEIVVFLWFMVICMTVLILNSGFTRVIKLSDRGSIVAIPATLILTAWLSKVIIASLIY
jgi:hypothetical protein